MEKAGHKQTAEQVKSKKEFDRNFRLFKKEQAGDQVYTDRSPQRVRRSESEATNPLTGFSEILQCRKNRYGRKPQAGSSHNESIHSAVLYGQFCHQRQRGNLHLPESEPGFQDAQGARNHGIQGVDKQRSESVRARYARKRRRKHSPSVKPE